MRSKFPYPVGTEVNGPRGWLGEGINYRYKIKTIGPRWITLENLGYYPFMLKGRIKVSPDSFIEKIRSKRWKINIRDVRFAQHLQRMLDVS